MNCKYRKENICDEEDGHHVNGLIRKLFDKVFKPFKHENEYKYQSHRRLNIIIDRRNIDDEKDTVIVFEPPSDCNTIPKEHADIPEIFFDQSRTCLIPKLGHGKNAIKHELKEDEKSISARDIVQGQISYIKKLIF